MRDAGCGIRDPGSGFGSGVAETAKAAPRLVRRNLPFPRPGHRIWAGFRLDGVLLRSCAMPIQSYRDLEAWQIGMDFVVRVYAVTKSFPREEMYGLTSQLRRAAVAVPSNVSEGHQHGTKAYLHFIVLALGSLAEAETQLEIARRLRLASDDELETASALAVRARQVLLGLRRALAARV